MRIGIDLGGSHIAVGLINGDNIIDKKEKSFSDEDRNDIESIIETTIIEYVEEIMKEQNINIRYIEKIGIAVPGTCSEEKVVKAENLGIRDFNIVSKLKEKYKDIEINLANDGKCAAMCEKVYGSLKQ